MNELARRILDVLPQTQCTRCSYSDCAGYAQALAQGQARINQCPPGGSQGVARLAELTGLAPEPLDAHYGTEQPRQTVFVDEAWCIGCTLCLDVCPTDAILGANKRMHVVIEAYCTGCGLCLPVCPVDCLRLENASGSATGWDAWSPEQAATARERYAIRSKRRMSDVPSQPVCEIEPEKMSDRQALIASALQRARERRPA